jgi:hypothetical protein
MKLIEAIKRLGYTIGNQHKPNATDAEALNSVIEFVNESNKHVTQDNLLFAKMYAYVLKEFTNHYNDVNFASQMINKEILLKDLDLTALKETLQTLEIETFYKSKGFKDSVFGIGLDFETIKYNHSQNKELAKTISEIELKETFDFWSDEKVKQNFEMNINLAIQKYK